MVTKKIQTGNSIKFLSLFAIAIVVSSCGGNLPETTQQQSAKADFLTIEPTTAEMLQRYPGTIEGAVNVELKSQVTGYLDKIYVKEGDYINKGQSLFKIKSEVFQEQVNNSRASLKAAQASLATAKIEVAKIRPLVEGKVVSPLQLETAQAQYEAAAAQVAQAKAALGSSQINANFAEIKAPVSGYIGRIPKRIGNLVTPSDTMPLTTLSEINKVFIYFSMSEADFIIYTRNKKEGTVGNTVQIIMADGKTYEYNGVLESASGNIDQSTGTMALKAIFPNPDKLLRAGGAARVVLTKKVNSALLVPMAAVKDLQDKFFVFTLGDSNKVTMKPLEIEGRTGVNYIVKSGIKSGEKVAVTSIDALTDGMKVNPAAASPEAFKK